ncbi:hypothetical protein AMS68_005085 [Peltaster fructicola]|uniref:Tautomerase cis-CaaD-like domain-containing protein n=1 Tax=Peltaster fructicola TaxID=286661 RepID=A0A6H0XYA0_9PEZI|nr:hypothetical protein AMS68_005085 [Peltaster fructicola]
MPFYTVHHADTLTEVQQEKLALAITDIHSTKFTTPKIFVNVAFQDISKEVRFVGGKRKSANLIAANVRHGPSRTSEDYADLIRQIQAAWLRIVPGTTMNRVVLNGSIVAGMEAGVILPSAGGDKQWISDNWEMFNQRAEAGDEEMRDIVEDIKERGLLGDGRTAMQRLEEALGWGESA